MLKTALKNTTIRLSEEHKALIAKTGKSASTVIREALDNYFMTNETPVTRSQIKKIVRAEVNKAVSNLKTSVNNK